MTKKTKENYLANGLTEKEDILYKRASARRSSSSEMEKIYQKLKQKINKK